MEEIKRRFIDSVAAKLTAAPQSAAKDELIEELSDNLYRRFLDMTNAGLEEEAAFTRSMEDLGDVDELLSYLGVDAVNRNIAMSPESGPTSIEAQDGKTFPVKPESGQPVVIRPDGESGERIIINRGPDAGAEPDAPQDAPEDHKDERGTRYDYQGDLDAILAGVSAACNTAIDQAKAALQQARDALQRRTTWEKENNRVTVHFNTHPGTSKTPESSETSETPEAPETPETPETPEPPKGWEFEAELDTDAGRFFAGGGPKEKKDVVYGFGYDKARGGFFAQWGDYQDGGEDVRGPHFYGEGGSFMEHQDDGSYSVTALKDLRGIEVITSAGDVTIRDSEASDAGVIIDGDVDDLDVTCSADGVLTIREGRTASSSFFSRRGFRSADVELSLPRRHWDLISVSTASGDLELDGFHLDIDQLSVKTASGDAHIDLQACKEFYFHSASGDLELELRGGCDSLRAEAMSGDINLQGQLGCVQVKTASGDIELEGLVEQFQGSTMSGDVQVETTQLPQTMDLSSKSGDVEARIPEAGPFTAHIKTVTGELNCAFRMNYIDGIFVYGDGSGPAYSMTSISGDVSLERR